MISQEIKKLVDSKFDEELFTKSIANILNLGKENFVGKKVYQDGFKNVRDSRWLYTFRTDDDKIIDVLIIELEKSSSVENARVMQRGMVEKYLKAKKANAEWVDGVLVAFYFRGDLNWRLSLVEMDVNDKGKEEFSPPKRKSFLVGEHEKSITALRQLESLLKISQKGKSPLFSQIQEAFSVEKVTKEFFDEYKKLFFSLIDNLKKNDDFTREVVGNHGIKVADFAKKLLGQIVFLYFLQKKGWLGVEEGKKWGNGNKKFLRMIFEECINGGDKRKERGGENFFNDYLEHLFYDTLNKKDRGNNSNTGDQSYSPYFRCRIPYLNGGLFEPQYDWKNTYIDIDNSVFEKIFDTFDLFNFTVYESDPLEQEVAVDPEMLGKVFENLLDVEDRKSKGAFYTPREIVHYMCRESLINYLITYQTGHPA